MPEYYKLTELVADMLRTHGVPGEMRDGWFRTQATVPVAIVAEAEVEDDESGSASSSLTVLIRCPDGRELQEVYADLGQDTGDVLDNNLQSFTHSLLHPLAAGLTDGEGDCDEKVLTVGPHTYSLFTRGYLCKGYGMEEFPAPPSELEPLMYRVLTELPLDKDLHLVSVYYGRMEGREPMSEFWVDGHAVPRADREVCELDWAPTTGFYSNRLVGLLRRHEPGVFPAQADGKRSWWPWGRKAR